MSKSKSPENREGSEVEIHRRGLLRLVGAAAAGSVMAAGIVQYDHLRHHEIEDQLAIAYIPEKITEFMKKHSSVHFDNLARLKDSDVDLFENDLKKDPALQDMVCLIQYGQNTPSNKDEAVRRVEEVIGTVKFGINSVRSSLFGGSVPATEDKNHHNQTPEERRETIKALEKERAYYAKKDPAYEKLNQQQPVPVEIFRPFSKQTLATLGDPDAMRAWRKKITILAKSNAIIIAPEQMDKLGSIKPKGTVRENKNYDIADWMDEVIASKNPTSGVDINTLQKAPEIAGRHN